MISSILRNYFNNYSRTIRQASWNSTRFLSSSKDKTMGSAISRQFLKQTNALKISDEKEEEIQEVVCQIGDLKENDMREFKVAGEGDILLVKQGDKLRAIGNKCTHYGAPLIKGALSENRVRCPWHGACFNLDTGDIEDFPGLESLHCHKVSVNAEGGVVITTMRENLKQPKRMKPMVKCSMQEKREIVILGGGPAGSICAETLRQEGFKGPIALVTAEPFTFYDRIKISKMPDAGSDKLTLRDSLFYQQNSIKVYASTRALEIDPVEKKVILSDGNTILKYDKLLISTGSSPTHTKTPGSDLNGIYYCRTITDGQKISSQINPNKHVVILGSSFIGMELAAYCCGKVKSVTVVGRDSVPFKKVWGEEIGKCMAKFFRTKGVILEMNATVDCIERSNQDASYVGGIKLRDGRLLPADIVIIGYGTFPNTGNGLLSKCSNIKTDSAGYLKVNEFLATGDKDIYAAGDVALAPVLGGRYTAAIGHWGLAHYHGRYAALNMLDQAKPINSVPFFWTMLFGKSVRYAGYCPEYDSIKIEGDLEEMTFCIYYIEKGGRVAAVATLGMDPVAAQFAELLNDGKELMASSLEPDPSAWRNL